MNDEELIKTAAEAEATEKQAVQPLTAPMAGGGAPMAADPTMMAGVPPTGSLPPIPPVGGGAGGPPGDVAGAPGAFDPALAGLTPGGPPPGEGPPPFDPTMLGPLPGEGPPPEDINEAERDLDEDQKPDTMVPLPEVKDFTIGVIEAVKGKKTQEAVPPGMEGAGGEPTTPPGAGPLAAIGGAPAAEPLGAMPKLSDIQAQMDEDLG